MATVKDTPVVDPPVEEVSAPTIDDGSTVLEGFQDLLSSAKDALGRVLSAARTEETVSKVAAYWLVRLRSAIRDADDYPDWAATTAQYRVSYSDWEDSFWVEKSPDKQKRAQEKRKVQGAIRQQVSRNYLEAAIVQYVLDNVNGMPKVGDLKWTEAKGDSPSDTPSVLAGDIPEVLKKAVAAQYAHAKLAVPQKFGGPARGGNGGGGGTGNPENVVAAFDQALSAVGTLAPKHTALSILRVLSALSEKLEKDSEIPDRADVEAIMGRIGVVGMGTAKRIVGKYGPNETDEKVASAVASARYDKDKDKS